MATISAQPTCTDGMAENSSASKPPCQEYTDWPYRTAVSTRPVPGSSRGGATGMNWMSRLTPVNRAMVVLICGYRSRCRTYSQIRQAPRTGKCRMS